MMFKSKLASAVLIVLASSSAADAIAADQETGTQRPQSTIATLDDMVVTAQRRSERIQDVPLSVSAFSAEHMDRHLVRDTEALTRTVPNLQGSNGTGLGTGNNYSLRGLFNTESLATFDSPVATYIDGIYQGRIGGSNVALFDVERVEVLRGPQGTLFGKNTTGGAINIILRPASPDYNEGMLEASYGSYSRKSLRASGNFVLNDNAAIRASAFHVEDDGYVRNTVTGGRNNDENSTGVRVAAHLRPTPSSSWDLSASHVDMSKAFISHDIVNGRRISTSGLERLGDLVPSKKGQLDPNSNKIENTLLVSDFKLDTSIGELQILTGYSNLDHGYLIDFFNSPQPTGGFTYANQSESEQFSHEVKISGQLEAARLAYVAGVFYMNERNTTDFADVLNVTGVPRVTADRYLRNTTDSFAVYAQLDWQFTDTLTATAGVRWTHEKKDLSLFANDNPNWVTSFDQQDLIANGIPLKLSTSKATPRFAIEWKPHNDLMMFASVANGFKSGGWNGRAGSAAAFLAFEPEAVWSYEAGLKSEWFDNILRLNVSAFQSDVSDLQIPTAFTAPSGALSFLTRNFADFRSRGVEIEVAATPIVGLNLGLNLGFLDSKWTELNPAILEQQQLCLNGVTSNCSQGIVRGDGSIADPARSPEYTAAFSVDYVVPLTDAITLTPAASMVFMGSYNVSTNGLPAADVGAYSVLNTGLTLADEDRGWQLGIECTNCTNEEFLTSALSNRLYYSEPRRIDIRFRKIF